MMCNLQDLRFCAYAQKLEMVLLILQLVVVADEMVGGVYIQGCWNTRRSLRMKELWSALLETSASSSGYEVWNT